MNVWSRKLNIFAICSGLRKITYQAHWCCHGFRMYLHISLQIPRADCELRCHPQIWLLWALGFVERFCSLIAKATCCHANITNRDSFPEFKANWFTIFCHILAFSWWKLWNRISSINSILYNSLDVIHSLDSEFFEERYNMIALTARTGLGCITVSRPALCDRQTQM